LQFRATPRPNFLTECPPSFALQNKRSSWWLSPFFEEQISDSSFFVSNSTNICKEPRLCRPMIDYSVHFPPFCVLVSPTPFLSFSQEHFLLWDGSCVRAERERERDCFCGDRRSHNPVTIRFFRRPRKQQWKKEKDLRPDPEGGGFHALTKNSYCIFQKKNTLSCVHAGYTSRYSMKSGTDNLEMQRCDSTNVLPFSRSCAKSRRKRFEVSFCKYLNKLKAYNASIHSAQRVFSAPGLRAVCFIRRSRQ
jgi:hypothetical protein